MYKNHKLQLISGLIVFFCFAHAKGVAQVNTSQKANYKAKSLKDGSYYKTVYDNGYVVLRDGNKLEGQISLYGQDYDNIYSIRLKTNTGEKYDFMPRSLSEFGLANSTVNDTPGLFSWTSKQTTTEKPTNSLINPIGTKSKPRLGYASFGYVKLKSGDLIEGEVFINESSGKIKNIEVKGADRKKVKFDIAEISNYGVKVYKDEKFDGAWSVIKWKTSAYQSSFSSNKSVALKGYVEKNSGQIVEGYLQLLKKADVINQINVSQLATMKKPEKIGATEIKSYGIKFTIKEYYDYLAANTSKSIETIPPYQRFYAGSILLDDGTFLEGLVARASWNIDGDMLFAKDESSLVQGFNFEHVEDVIQNIKFEDQRAYDQYVYDVTHVKGYLKDPDPFWIYESKNPENPTIFKTKYQPGYVILTSGEEIVGSLQVSSQGTIVKYNMQQGDAKAVKYPSKEVKEHGLVIHNAKTAFAEKLYSEQRPGFIVLMSSGEIVEGSLQVVKEYKTDRLSDEGVLVTTFIVNGTSYEEPKIKYYGLQDVPVRELTEDGIVVYEDKRMNFNPGSFSYNGQEMKGYVAWAPQMEPGKDDAILFAESLDSKANLYYLDKGVSNIKQEIEEEFAAYDPADNSFLLTKTTATEVATNGHLIMADGSKLEGQVEMSFPPKLWFATELKITRSDGTVENYMADGSVASVYLVVDGKEKRFQYFDKSFVEVLQQEGDWIHFKNPHPTTPTFWSDVANSMLQSAAAAGQEQLDKEIAKVAVAASLEGKENLAESAANFLEREKTDYSNAEFLTIYADEHILYNTKSNRHAMYIPKVNFKQLDGELMGSLAYLNMASEEQKGLKKMNNPMVTMKFLQEVFK